MPLPLTLLTTIDPVLRELATAGLLLDVPNIIIIQQDKGQKPGMWRRRISDYSGVLEDETLRADGGCLGCLMREDLLSTAVRVAELGRWEAMALVPTPGTASVPLAQALAGFAEGDRSFDEILDLRSIAQLTDLSSLLKDLMGEELLVDRGLAINDEDRRAVNEVLCQQIELADLLVAGVGAPVDSVFLDHLRAAGAARILGPHPQDWGVLFERLHSPERLLNLSPHHRMPTSVPDQEGVWTIDLHSDSPMHPERILPFMRYLSESQVRARGRFWLPGRPKVMVEWDGIGGQLSIGAHENPDSAGLGTRIIVTGCSAKLPDELTSQFQRALVSDSELIQGIDYWAIQDDGFDPWLGQRANPYAQHPLNELTQLTIPLHVILSPSSLTPMEPR